MAYPLTRRGDAKDVIHGVEVVDPYRWLEDGKAVEVQYWMHTEDQLTRAELSKIPIRDALATRLKELVHEEEHAVPMSFGGRLFYQRRNADRERATVYWREGNGSEHLLLDPDAWSKEGELFLGDWWPSWDGKKVVYQVRRKNADAATLRVVDVATGSISESDVVEGAEWPEPQWTPKSDGFYYQWVSADPALRAERFAHAEGRFHKLGDDTKHDPLVRAPMPSQSGCPLQLDVEGRWLVASVSRGWSRNDVYFEDLREAHPKWKTLVEGRNALFDVRIYRGTLFVRSTDGTPNGELFAIDPRKPERSAWRKIAPERHDAPLAGYEIIGRRLLLRYMQDVITRVEVHELDGALVRSFPTRIGETSLAEGTPDGDEAYYAFESYDQPRQIYKMSIQSGTESVWYQTRVPADISRLVVEQVFFPSKDGTRVPMFILHAKDMKRDGTAPLLLNGYGAANVTVRPRFNALLVPWIERGGVYAFAHLRGGGEYGEAWHTAGSLRKKQNTFDDFIGAAEYLIRERYTSPDHLASLGRSWGGLLVAAALIQRPDLFRAVICGVPQTDMIRFPLTGLGKTNFAEFGNPDDPDDFRALFAYSPYHHVAQGARYPAVLVEGAVADERVDPLHARKFAAALQAATTGGSALLRVEWDAGHMGSGLVSTEAEKRADEYAFILNAMGVAGH